MTDPKDQITRLVQDAEEAAYKRGWQDCAASILEAATEAHAQRPNGSESDDLPFPPADETRRTGRPPSVAVQVVEDCINSSPGKKGVEIVKAAQMVNPAIPERTVRTALRRLKISKKIWQRNGLWYPKPRQRPENENEEAISSPPHQ